MPESDAWIELGAAQAEIAARKGQDPTDDHLKRATDKNRDWLYERGLAMVFVVLGFTVFFLVSSDASDATRYIAIGSFVAFVLIIVMTRVTSHKKTKAKRAQDLETLRREKAEAHDQPDRKPENKSEYKTTGKSEEKAEAKLKDTSAENATEKSSENAAKKTGEITDVSAEVSTDVSKGASQSVSKDSKNTKEGTKKESASESTDDNSDPNSVKKKEKKVLRAIR